MMKRLMFFAIPAEAQTHRCDNPPVSAFTLDAGTVGVDVCWNEKDETGQPAVLKEWNLMLDGVKQRIVLLKQPGAAQTGEFNFTGTFSVLKGIHTVGLELCIDNGIGGQRCLNADTVTLNALSKPASKPRIVRIF